MPESHIPFFFKNNPDFKKMCQDDVQCPFKKLTDTDQCWGYETACERAKRYANPDCTGDSKRWTKSKEDQEYKFWSTADFGMIAERRAELKTYCRPDLKEDSSLQCVNYMRYCKATNLFLDFSSNPITEGRDERDRYREDVLGPGLIGGHCRLDVAGLKAQGEHKSPLQSCVTWKAFTDHTIIPLKNLDGKRVCIKDAVFSLLPRMRYGLYYNMPLMPGCYGSSFIKAFSEHILHRLNVPQTGPHHNKIRVTVLARDTLYRNILNQEELVKAMKSDGELDVSLVKYNR
ncbi:EGF domain-specific O-linked N-acetylglucosamine transferase [Elysia marginata]|uniref:EGF domain-specific O-linked N-acetylglucosamine transferase n=1 Tax=Elysia marginata TaxID=1093978 RepID=A0AAV4FYV3_9GAST|nr:EGF domain-specific O-linked N-acetylglucosamine transferase [Elysia marginata]